jgi:hypothetical protein
MPAHSQRAGELLPELAEAYALGKMLDHSGWNGLLRNNITPSDIDMPGVTFAFDNRGAIIFADLSRSYTGWDRTLTGQRRLYEALAKWGPHCSVLCKHNITPQTGRKIDTLRDIEQFQVMVWDFVPVLSPIYNGQWWQHFVLFWVNNSDGPMRIRRHILGASVGMIKPEKGPPTEQTE